MFPKVKQTVRGEGGKKREDTVLLCAGATNAPKRQNLSESGDADKDAKEQMGGKTAKCPDKEMEI